MSLNQLVLFPCFPFDFYTTCFNDVIKLHEMFRINLDSMFNFINVSTFNFNIVMFFIVIVLTYITPIFSYILKFVCFDYSNRPLIMDSALCESLHKQILLTFHWTQELIYSPSDILSLVNLANLVGSNHNIPINCYNQLAEDKFLSISYFCLPLRYKGAAVSSEVKSFFENLCEGASLLMGY